MSYLGIFASIYLEASLISLSLKKIIDNMEHSPTMHSKAIASLVFQPQLLRYDSLL